MGGFDVPHVCGTFLGETRPPLPLCFLSLWGSVCGIRQHAWGVGELESLGQSRCELWHKPDSGREAPSTRRLPSPRVLAKRALVCHGGPALRPPGDAPAGGTSWSPSSPGLPRPRTARFRGRLCGAFHRWARSAKTNTASRRSAQRSALPAWHHTRGGPVHSAAWRCSVWTTVNL